jgi:cell division septal protein FtsQ
VFLALGLFLFGAWTWLRDSSLVSVEHVKISGVQGADAATIRSALRSAAQSMTTLDVQVGRLRTAVAPFPEVKSLDVETQFPHGMSIRVIEHHPVGLIELAGRHIAVAGDGTLLRGVSVTSQLPVIPVSVPPVGRRLTEASAAGDVAVLAAAPVGLVSRISQVTSVAGHGPVAQIRDGPSIYFGDESRLGLKWEAATEVLADASSAGASYIDVSDPEHPAAGDAGPTTNSSPGTSTSSGAGASGPTTSSPAGAAQTSTPASTSTTTGG